MFKSLKTAKITYQQKLKKIYNKMSNNTLSGKKSKKTSIFCLATIKISFVTVEFEDPVLQKKTSRIFFGKFNQQHQQQQ